MLVNSWIPGEKSTESESVTYEKKTEIIKHQWVKAAIVGDENNINADVQDVTRTSEDVEAVDSNLTEVVELNAKQFILSTK